MQGVASEFALNHNTIALLHVQSTQINEQILSLYHTMNTWKIFFLPTLSCRLFPYEMLSCWSTLYFKIWKSGILFFFPNSTCTTLEIHKTPCYPSCIVSSVLGFILPFNRHHSTCTYVWNPIATWCLQNCVCSLTF